MFKRRRAADLDFFRVKDRRATEDEQPWFLAEDDGPALEVGWPVRRCGGEDELDQP